MWNDKQHEQSLEDTERKKFDAGSEFQNLLKNVSRRLGFLYSISTGTLIIVYYYIDYLTRNKNIKMKYKIKFLH